MTTHRLPGPRDVRATLDHTSETDSSDATGPTNRVVVACPPHPQMGGDRRDGRLRAVSDALVERGIDCLRFDYGPWDEGVGEQTDAQNALAWAREEYDRVGLFGYSFGGSVALLAAADVDHEPAGSRAEPDAVSVLAPGTGSAELDVVGSLADIPCPVQVVHGARDDVVDWEPIVDRARELGHAVERIEADHFFVGQQTKVAGRVAAFFIDVL